MSAVEHIIRLKATIAAKDKEIEQSSKLKNYIIDVFRQHEENKWNWSSEDVLHIVRVCVMSDEEFEALKGELHPNKRKREDCADCPCPERHCSECINQAKVIEQLKAEIKFLQDNQKPVMTHSGGVVPE